LADSIAPPGTLVYGIQLPIQMLSEAIREPWEREATVEDLAAVAIAAEQAGCTFVAACDHVALPRNEYTARMSTTWYDPVATLAYLAARTSTVRLLTSVLIAAYRHPLHIAKSFLTLDHLSGGRAILGVGAGHVEGEFAALGVDFARRGRRTDETIDAVRAAFAQEHSSHHGEFFDYDDMGLSPRPVHGDIPVWIGGSSAPALRRVGERGDGWIPQGTPRDRMQHCVDEIRRHRDAVRPGAHIDLGFMPEYLYVGRPGWDTGGYTRTGSPEALAESLRDAYAFGCNVLHLHFRSRDRAELCDQLAAFARDVAPLLAR
jgi:probable F420-dependent oxidoreductase